MNNPFVLSSVLTAQTRPGHSSPTDRSHSGHPTEDMLRPTALHQALLGALLAMGMLPATTIHAQSVSVDELHTRQLIIEANRQKAHEAWLRENTLPTVTSIGQREKQANEQRGSYTIRRSRASTGLSLSLRQTPQSVSVITHQQLQDQEASTLADTMRYTPGVSANTYDARGVSLHARGFSDGTGFCQYLAAFHFFAFGTAQQYAS